MTHLDWFICILIGPFKKRNWAWEKKLEMEELYSEEKLDRSSPVLWVSRKKNKDLPSFFPRSCTEKLVQKFWTPISRTIACFYKSLVNMKIYSARSNSWCRKIHGQFHRRGTKTKWLTRKDFGETNRWIEAVEWKTITSRNQSSQRTSIQVGIALILFRSCAKPGFAKPYFF